MMKPDDRIHTENIPSQVFTEYLRYMFKFEGEIAVDGVIYKSSVNDRHCVLLFCNQEKSKELLEFIDFMETYHRNPSKHHIEDT